MPTTGWTRAGNTPIAVAAPAAGAAVSRVRIRVLSQTDVRAAGGRILGFEVTRADGGSGVGHIAVSVDYVSLSKAFGGNFGSRLRLVRATSCTVEVACHPERVTARNEPSRSMGGK